MDSGTIRGTGPRDARPQRCSGVWPEVQRRVKVPTPTPKLDTLEQRHTHLHAILQESPWALSRTLLCFR